MGEIELSIEKGLAMLRLNRPEALNALSSSLLGELSRVLDRIERESAISGLIVTGTGRAFVAGADIEEIAQLDREQGLAFARLGQTLFSRIERLDLPVIAAVNGFALGGGCELAMACHVRLASTKARFGQPEVKLGILPGFGGTQRLPRLVSRGDALKILLSGAILSAEEALRIGLVSEVLEPDALLPRATELLAQIDANGPRALAATLTAVREGLEMTQEAGLDVEARLFSELCGTEEMQEGTRAFLEKREPRFR
ncbi:MAG: enoyl-CoA hydratase-related protein [Myxococcota bacterium]